MSDLVNIGTNELWTAMWPCLEKQYEELLKKTAIWLQKIYLKNFGNSLKMYFEALAKLLQFLRRSEGATYFVL